MRLSNHWHESIQRHPFKVDGVRAIYVNSMLRGMAYAISGIFLPLYVYNWGVGMGGIRYGLGVTFLMVILERIILGLATISFGKLVARMGFKWSEWFFWSTNSRFYCRKFIFTWLLMLN